MTEADPFQRILAEEEAVRARRAEQLKAEAENRHPCFKDRFWAHEWMFDAPPSRTGTPMRCRVCGATKRSGSADETIELNTHRFDTPEYRAEQRAWREMPGRLGDQLDDRAA